MTTLLTKRIGRRDQLARADSRLFGALRVVLNTLSLELHLLVLAESNLALIIDDLLVGT